MFGLVKRFVIIAMIVTIQLYAFVLPVTAVTAATPVESVTTFGETDNYPVTDVDAGGPAGYLVSNIVGSGWDFRVFANNDSPDTGVAVEKFTEQTHLAYGYSSTGAINVNAIQLSSNDGQVFDLNSVDVTFDTDEATTLNMQLVGYRNGNPVAGAALAENVANASSGGPLVQFDVSGNPAFDGIDAFRVLPPSGVTGITAIGVDNIDAASFRYADASTELLHFEGIPGESFGEDRIAAGGEGGSTAISWIDIQTFGINDGGELLENGNMVYHDLNDWGYPPIINWEMGSTSTPSYGLAVKSADGSNFKLSSLHFLDWGNYDGDTYAIEAFDNGRSKGKATFAGNTNDHYISLDHSFILSSIFDDIDEVRMYRDAGTPGSYLALNDIAIAPPGEPGSSGIVFSYENSVADYGSKTVTHTVGGESLVAQSVTQDLTSSYGSVGEAINGSDSLATDFTHALGEESVTFSLADGKAFDLTSIRLGEYNSETSFILSSAKGSITTSADGWFTTPPKAMNQLNLDVAANENASKFQGITSFAVTAADGLIDALVFDDITLDNIADTDSSSLIQIVSDDIPADNTGAFNKTIAGHEITFTPAANGQVYWESDSADFGGIYMMNCDILTDTDCATEYTISPPSGYTFDLNAFDYYSDRDTDGAVELTLTVTYADDSTNEELYTLSGDEAKHTLNAFITAPNDVKSVKFFTNRLVYFNNFDLTDIKAIPAPSPSVNKVTVSPATVSIAQGGTQQLTATVDVTGGAAQTVIWTIVDGTGKVSVDATGLVSAASDAIPGDYTVTATSTADASKAGTAIITVTANPVTASGLTITAGDVTGPGTDGKTKLIVTPAAGAGNRLVYQNFGSGSVTVPNVGDTLSGYSDLPSDGVVPAANGDKLAVAEVDAGGNVVKFGQVTAVVADEPVEITGFDAIADVDAGTAGSASYADAAAVKAALPATAAANNNTVTVPVTTWVDTDGYNPSVAGSYTFTATLGAIPAGYVNSGSHTATVEVVVEAAAVESDQELGSEWLNSGGFIVTPSTGTHVESDPASIWITSNTSTIVYQGQLTIKSSSGNTFDLKKLQLYKFIPANSVKVTISDGNGTSYCVYAGGTTEFLPCPGQDNLSITAEATTDYGTSYILHFNSGFSAIHQFTISIDGTYNNSAIYDNVNDIGIMKFTVANPAAPSGVAANAANNGVTVDPTTVAVGEAVTLTAAGDRQSANGTVIGDEQYIPVSWVSSESADANGTFTLDGGSYTSTYVPAAAGDYTVTATFQQKQWDGDSWENAAGVTDTKTANVIVNAAPAATATVQIGTAAGVPGDIVTVPVTLTQAAKGVGSYGIKIAFVPTELEVEEVVDPSGDIAFYSDVNNTDGWLAGYWADITGGDLLKTTGDTLFNVKFKIKAGTVEGDKPLQVADEADVAQFSLTDKDLNELAKTLLAGKVVVGAAPVEITGFDVIVDVDAGTAGSANYANAAAVIAALPTTAAANNNTVTVPVTTWVDTDSYNPSVAGSYTFTATLGAIPAGYVNTGSHTATVEVVVKAAPIEITGFDVIADVDAGTAGSASYADAAAVIATLPTTAAANNNTVTVPVTTWVDTDTYNPSVAGSYTFTATLGAIPAGYANTGGHTATVEVVVKTAPIEILGFDAIADVDAGTAGSASYADAAAVIATLPTTAAANNNTVTVPVTTWVDTDTYNPSVAGSYTFTATLGAIPAGYTNSGSHTATVEVVVKAAPIEITGFDAIADVDAGTAGSASYADAAAVIAALPTTAAANNNTVTVPVTTWVDTDGYNPNVAGSYTFTATLGAIPTGYANSGSHTATVEVVVEAAPVEIMGFDAIADVDAGTAGSASYADAAAVIAALPTTAAANNNTVTVPVTTWVDTDSYNPNVAGSYTFTAMLGTIPAGYANSGSHTATVEVVVKAAPIEITGFDAIADVDAGTAGSASYADAAAVIAALPTTAAANNNTVTVPVTTWVDTDSYNPNVAGSYTFTATLGAIPAGYTNSGDHTATVEVVVKAAPVEITGFDAIADVDAGTAGSASYADAAAVIAALPTTAAANNNAVTVPVTTWMDTDSYNPNVAGSYTFTAMLGTIPAGYANTSGYTVTVEVVLHAQPATVPAAPTNVSAVAGNGQATITFTAPANNGGSAITGYEVTASPGGIKATGTTGTITVTGLSNGTSYTFTVKAINAAGSGASSAASNSVTPKAPSRGGSTTPPPAQPTTPSTPETASTGVDVLVNGKVENAGTATTTKVNDQTVITVAVDQHKLADKLAAEGQGAVVTIPVSAKSDAVVGELNGQMVKNMEEKQAVLEIKTDAATYTLPAQQINIDAISGQVGASVALEDIKIRIEIAAPAPDTVQVVEHAAEQGTFTIVAPPMNFTVKGTYGDTTVDVSKFNAYVERTVALPEGIDPSRITTGIVIDPDGTVRHVPTKVMLTEGKYYAVINSLTNSTYSVVWHPLAFADVANHWAKDAVNNMGSRMVIDGTGNGIFSPDRDITRAEFAAIMVRGLGLKLDSGAAPYSDVKAADWYNSVIQTAAAYRLISGFEDGTFRPNEKITREQAMVIIAKAMAITNLKTAGGTTEEALRPFADARDAAAWAAGSIAESVRAGIVSGRNAATLAPKAFMTRAEVAAIVERLLQKSELI